MNRDELNFIEEQLVEKNRAVKEAKELLTKRIAEQKDLAATLRGIRRTYWYKPENRRVPYELMRRRLVVTLQPGDAQDALMQLFNTLEERDFSRAPRSERIAAEPRDIRAVVIHALRRYGDVEYEDMPLELPGRTHTKAFECYYILGENPGVSVVRHLHDKFKAFLRTVERVQALPRIDENTRLVVARDLVSHKFGNANTYTEDILRQTAQEVLVELQARWEYLKPLVRDTHTHVLKL